MRKNDRIIEEIINIDTSIDQLKKTWDVLDKREIDMYEELEEKKHNLLQSLISNSLITVE